MTQQPREDSADFARLPVSSSSRATVGSSGRRNPRRSRRHSASALKKQTELVRGRAEGEANRPQKHSPRRATTDFQTSRNR